MLARYFALIAGVVFFVVGILGFTPGATHAPPEGAPELAVNSYYGYVLGLFPVNAIHNAIHILIGVLGIVAYRRFTAARRFARGLAVVYGVLAVMGIIATLQTTFGYVPLFGHDVWLHAVTAVIAAYAGWTVPADVVSSSEATLRT